MKHAISQYEVDANQFLEDTQTELSIVYLYTGKYFADDTEDRDVYQFTLTNARGSYSAKFGDSLNNTKYNQFTTGKKTCDYKQDWDFCKANKIHVSASGYIMKRKRKEPTSYDILACMDTYCPDTFDEFCDEYGYSDQPLKEHDKVMSIFLTCKEQKRGLERIFTNEQLEQLAEIN